MTFAKTLLAKLGSVGDFPRNSTIGGLFRQHGVADSAEFRRVKSLPRRDWLPPDGLLDCCESFFHKPGGTMALWPLQAAALIEAYEQKGLFLGAGVGCGKTLVSLLAPVAFEAKRPLLLTQASLYDKTLREIPEYGKHWRLHDDLTVWTYDVLSRERGHDALLKLRPDVVICDESHRLKNKSAARTRRFLRYFAEAPDTVLVAMSGTVARRSLRDYAHLLQLALGNARAPLPSSWRELQDWADALDIDVDEDKRMLPGVLLELCEGQETPREGYQRRLTQTPGVIITSKTSCPASLTLYRAEVAVPQSVSGALAHLISHWETPGGEQCSEALELWRHGRELSQGFYYRWLWPDGRPDIAWLEARRAWKAFARNTIRYGRKGLDSELQVAKAAAAGVIDATAYTAWINIRERCKPPVEAVWLDGFLINDVAVRARNGDAPALIWVEHDAVGRALATKGLPYFAAGATQEQILCQRNTPVVLSAHAHKEGKNLQPWARNIFASPSPSGADWDQLLGRTHREGQDADEVTAELYLHTSVLRDGFANAIRDAKYLHSTLGQEQKLLVATHAFAL